MTTFRRLTRRLNNIAARLEENLGRVITDVVEEVGERLVLATPVDTGFARANWRPSIGAPSPMPVSFLDPSGQATIGRINQVARQARTGQAVFLVNNAPYINKLNAGSSPQAPAGFVQAAVRQGAQAGIARAARRALLR